MTSEPSAHFRLAPDHPIFVGHFPGRPIVPGVMLMDWVLNRCASELDRPVSAFSFRQVKFLTPLAPGERADLRLEMGADRAAFRIERDAVLLATGILEWREHG